MTNIRFANPTPLPRFDFFEDEHDEIREFYGDVAKVVVPAATGVVVAATPYVVGAAIVAFAPPWMKPVGVAMLVPSPADIAYFAAGVAIGQWAVDHHPMFEWVH